jgi:hypothetical protein
MEAVGERRRVEWPWSWMRWVVVVVVESSEAVQEDRNLRSSTFLVQGSTKRYLSLPPALDSAQTIQVQISRAANSTLLSRQIQLPRELSRMPCRMAALVGCLWCVGFASKA